MPKQLPPATPDAAEPDAPEPDAPEPDAPEPDAPNSGAPRPGAPFAPHDHRFFAWIRSLGLARQPGWIGGVSAGIADRLGIDVMIVRGILIVVAVLGGPAVLLYALAWLVLPDSHDHIHLEDLMHGKIESPIVAIGVLIALSLLPVTQGFWWFGSLYWGAPHWGDSLGRAIWTVVILGLVVWLVVWFSRRASGGHPPRATAPRTTPATTDDRPGTVPNPAPPAPPAAPAADASAEQLAAWRESQAQWRADHEAFRQQQASERMAASQAAAAAAKAERAARAAAYREANARSRSNPLYSAALVGVALVAGSIAALAFGNGAPDAVDFLIGTAIAVGILGVGIIVNGALGHRSGGASGMATLLALVLICSAIVPQSPTVRYAGDATFVPHGHEGSSQTYAEGAGDVTLDLTSYFGTGRPPAAGHDWSASQVNLWVGAGDVTVIVPEDEYVDIRTLVLGHGFARSDHRFFVGTDRDWNNTSRAIEVEVTVGAGDIHIITAPSEMGNS